MEKIKKIAKYTINILGGISALIIGLNSIEGVTINYAHQIVEIIAVVNGVLGSYLLGQKAVNKVKEQ